MQLLYQQFVLLAIAISKISGLAVEINAGATVEESSISATGEDVNIIANSERASFGIGSDYDLKKAIEKWFGKYPNTAVLHGSDLHRIHKWPEVQRVLRPVKAEILSITSKPVTIASKTLTNKSNFTATFRTSISEQVTDTVSNEWSISGKIAFAQSIKYEVGFPGTGVGGETKFDFDLQGGISNSKSKSTTVRTETGLDVELKPGEAAVAELTASFGKMRARITYEAYLRGAIAVVYNKRYKGHYYWALPIEAVVGAKANKVQVVEDLEVGFYSNASATVKNAKTLEQMMLIKIMQLFHM